MDALQLLRDDHRKVKDLFRQFGEADDASTRKAIADEAVAELMIHAQLEEEIFYPAMERAGLKDLIGHAEEEHHVAENIMIELADMDTRDANLEAKFLVLVETVTEHVNEEESAIFPRAAELGFDKLDRIGDQLQELRNQIMSAPVSQRRRPQRRAATTRATSGTRTRLATGDSRTATATRGSRAAAGTKTASRTRTTASRASTTPKASTRASATSTRSAAKTTARAAGTTARNAGKTVRAAGKTASAAGKTVARAAGTAARAATGSRSTSAARESTTAGKSTSARTTTRTAGSNGSSATRNGAKTTTRSKTTATRAKVGARSKS